MSNQLTKADASRKRKQLGKPGSLLNALSSGDPIVWLSCVFMGLGNIVAGQFVKGILFLAIEFLFILFMVVPGGGGWTIYGGLENLSLLPSLGGKKMGFYTDANGFIWPDEFYHDSTKILLYGVVAVAVTVIFLVVWQASVRSGYLALNKRKAGKKPNNFWQDIKSLFDENVHKLLMFYPFATLVIFTVVPLAYMICMAFTNYSTVGDHLMLFDWVGLDTFKSLFESGSSISKQFTDVLTWTLIWAFFATFLNFFLGTFVAMIIDRKTTKLKSLWRTIFSLTVAVPQFVSLMLINSMFQNDGVVNTMLLDWGFIDEEIKWLSDFGANGNAVGVKIFVIVINLWVGIPYTIMQITGILKNIPADLYEAAKIDGANVVQQFMNITLPYMIFVMTPYIITSFTGNINNFNVIYLLTGGGPTSVGDSAGKTDLLVTWLYKLSVDQFKYNIAAVIGIFTFFILAIVSLVTYRSSGSYKDEEGFK